MFVKGVNLGNWLVLEKWMDTAVFQKTEEEDEYYLTHALPQEEYERCIRKHRRAFITEEDFKTIASWGLNSVRIPVPYFVFGDRAPFLGCVEELDHAFTWAEKYHLSILLDLHTVPYSQNGFDNGGLSGVCKWSQKKEEVEFVLSVLERLALRYGQSPELFGIQVLNEPITDPAWTFMNVQKRYPPKDAELAAGSKPNSLEFLEDFYQRAYKILRKSMTKEKYVIFHDAFRITSWQPFFQENHFENVMLDTHLYLMTAEALGCSQTVEEYDNYIRKKFQKEIEKKQSYIPTICGEWSLFNSMGTGMDTKGGQSVLNGVIAEEKKSLSEEEKNHLFTTVAKAYFDAWKNTSGYYFWSYKVIFHDDNWKGWDSWSMQTCIEKGWITKEMIADD